jgi:hypothetical protein
MADNSHILSALQSALGTGLDLSPSSIVGAGILHGIGLIRSRYVGNRDPDYDMLFHSVDHTVGVIRRAGLLVRAMKASEREVQLALLGGAFHDVVQNWEPNATPDGKVLRKRFTVKNEQDSAAEGVSWMRSQGVFHETDYQLVTQAILATIPGWDAQNGTVSQPNLTPDSPPVIRGVALADLGMAGMDGAEYLKSGDELFREENLDIGRAIRACRTRADIPPERLEGYKARMLAWCRAQVGFARGRRARLEQELGNLNGQARADVLALFTGFDTAISGADEVVKTREPLPPWEVARSMGYSLPAG